MSSPSSKSHWQLVRGEEEITGKTLSGPDFARYSFFPSNSPYFFEDVSSRVTIILYNLDSGKTEA